MLLYLYITLGILSSWLIFHAILCYMVSIYDMSFDFILTKGLKRIKYGVYLGVSLLFSYYIFFVRLRRVGKMFDIYEMAQILNNFISLIPLLDRCLLLIVLVLLIVFWILLLRCIYQYFRKCILALFLYYYQYRTFKRKCYFISHIAYDYENYVYSRVKLFTKNEFILNTVYLFWPINLNILERNLFHFFIPYLIIFDMLIQEGQITKIFIILPWFYIYTLIRSFFVLFNKLYQLENMELSETLYGAKKGFKW